MKRIYFIKSHFFAGLLVVIPLGVIGWILVAALGSLWRVHQILPRAWQPDYFLADPALATLFNLLLTLGLAIVLVIGISLLGWTSKQFLGRKILEVIEAIIHRIPVIRSVYSALDQLLRALAAGGGHQFNRVVYLEYPRKGLWTLAFVTGSATSMNGTSRFLNVYVPTTPNPTSGFHLIVPEDEVRESHLSVEEAFKTLLSLGIAQPRGEVSSQKSR